MGPPQTSHTVTSKRNTRASKWAQRRREDRLVGDAAAAHEPAMEGELAVHVVEVIQAAYDSARSAQVMKL